MNWTTYHRREREPKAQKNDQILPLHKSLASFFTKRPIKVLPYGSHYSESPISLLPELVETLAVTLTHRMQKAFPQAKWINELLPI